MSAAVLLGAAVEPSVVLVVALPEVVWVVVVAAAVVSVAVLAGSGVGGSGVGSLVGRVHVELCAALDPPHRVPRQVT